MRRAASCTAGADELEGNAGDDSIGMQAAEALGEAPTRVPRTLMALAGDRRAAHGLRPALTLAAAGGMDTGMSTTVTIHGIQTCDTMKKARAWLESRGIAHAFHDDKVAGIDATTLTAWAKTVGWEKLLNRSGTTFRKLPDAEKHGLTEARALALMAAQPSMIRRPVLAIGDRLIVGFDPAAYDAAMAGLPRG